MTERVVGRKAVWTNAIAGCGAGLAFGVKNGPMVVLYIRSLRCSQLVYHASVLQLLVLLLICLCFNCSFINFLFSTFTNNTKFYSNGERPNKLRMRFVSATVHSYSPFLLMKR